MLRAEAGERWNFPRREFESVCRRKVEKDMDSTKSIYDLTVRDIHAIDRPLAEYRGKVLLIVNTASKCGFTPQYKALQALHEKYASRGLVILGFPCNQFGAQEPGNEDEIASFCSLNYGVAFPMFQKVEVNGSAASPLFQLLKKEAPGLLGTEAIKWNFTKFLVDRQGKIFARYAPSTSPDALESDIERLLDQAS